MSEPQNKNDAQGHASNEPLGVPGLTLGDPAQTLLARSSRPSDDNQRHSNKVESIEVLIHANPPEFLPHQPQNPGLTPVQVASHD